VFKRKSDFIFFLNRNWLQLYLVLLLILPALTVWGETSIFESSNIVPATAAQEGSLAKTSFPENRKATITCTLCLPYLAGNGFGTNWWTGIALTNTGKKATSVSITYVADGVNLVQKILLLEKSVRSFSLSEVEDLFSTLPSGSPIYAQVKSAKPINAFVIIGDGTRAQGYLGLHGECGCGVASGCD